MMTETQRDVTAQDLRIPAADGFNLAATRFAATDDTTGSPVAVISSAAAVPRSFYAPFAHALAARGGTVYTYDYRGIGGSINRPLGEMRVRMREWGQLDARGVVEEVARLHPQQPLHWIGQSYGGGFAIGLNPSNHLIARHLGIAVPHGYYGEMDGALERVKVAAMMRVGIPLACALVGYLPGRRLGFGEDMPKGAALEWRDWILSRNSMWDTIPHDALAPYRSFRAPMAFLRLTDDPWASEVAVQRMATAFTSAAESHILRIAPAEVGATAIGHLGFFRSRFADSLWPVAFRWLAGGPLSLDGRASA